MKKSKQRRHVRRSKKGKLFNAGQKKFKYSSSISKHIDNIRVYSQMPKETLKQLKDVMILYKSQHVDDKYYDDCHLLIDTTHVLGDMLRFKTITDSEYDGAMRYIDVYVKKHQT
jgi:hypothetical protein